jgi:hypothetical protein
MPTNRKRRLRSRLIKYTKVVGVLTAAATAGWILYRLSRSGVQSGRDGARAAGRSLRGRHDL